MYLPPNLFLKRKYILARYRPKKILHGKFEQKKIHAISESLPSHIVSNGPSLRIKKDTEQSTSVMYNTQDNIDQLCVT